MYYLTQREVSEGDYLIIVCQLPLVPKINDRSKHVRFDHTEDDACFPIPTSHSLLADRLEALVRRHDRMISQWGLSHPLTESRPGTPILEPKPGRSTKRRGRDEDRTPMRPGSASGSFTPSASGRSHRLRLRDRSAVPPSRSLRCPARCSRTLGMSRRCLVIWPTLANPTALLGWLLEALMEPVGRQARRRAAEAIHRVD